MFVNTLDLFLDFLMVTITQQIITRTQTLVVVVFLTCLTILHTNTAVNKFLLSLCFDFTKFVLVTLPFLHSFF